jgi:hypothetical protein
VFCRVVGFAVRCEGHPALLIRPQGSLCVTSDVPHSWGVGTTTCSVTATRAWHAAKGQPIHAHDPATQFRIEPIDDRVDEHPFVPVVVAQDHSDAFAKLKLLFPDASRAAAEATKIPFVRRTELKSSQM